MYNNEYSDYDEYSDNNYSEDLYSDYDSESQSNNYWEQKRLVKEKKRKKKTTGFLIASLCVVIIICAVTTLYISSDTKKEINSIADTYSSLSVQPVQSSSNSSVNSYQSVVSTPIVSSVPNSGATQFRYFRSTLNSDQQKLYDDILSGIKNHEDRISAVTDVSDQSETILTYIYADNPDCFWFDCNLSYEIYSYSDHTELVVKPRYTVNKILSSSYQQKIDDYLFYMESATQNMTDYEKVKFVYESIIQDTTYDINYNVNTCQSVIVDKKGVCAGYATAFQLVLNNLGIPAILCLGSSEGEPHAWNMVQLDSNWFQVDVTYGDPEASDGNNWITYDYFLITDTEMMKDHEYDHGINYPECNSTLAEKENDHSLYEKLTA